jgi:hypothetical protein
MMTTKFLSFLVGTFVFAVAFCPDGQAQTEAEVFTAKNVVFAELGGNAGRYAVSYGRIFHQKGMLKLSGSAGFSMWHHYSTAVPASRSTYWLPAIPLEISAFLGKSKHHLEIGAGILSLLELSPIVDIDNSRISEEIGLRSIVPVRIGYRYQKPEGGFFLRIGYTPYFTFPGSPDGNIIFHPILAGLSLGKSF